jgi:hypothetical protein
MPKLKQEVIEQSDLIEHLDSQSDFDFELSVLKTITDLGIECEHGGHYEDPVTNKSREFDIRAVKTIENYRVRMSIECKNIRENFPILISCVPRQEHEAYHEIAELHDPASDSVHMAHFFANRSRANTRRLLGKSSLYKSGDPVGKCTVQVGRLENGALSANDSELYEKWGQCLSSADDLFKRAYSDGRKDKKKKEFFSCVIPFVVVPNGRLWSVEYTADGSRKTPPTPVARVSCFSGKVYRMGDAMQGEYIRVSHIEIVTLDGLVSFIETSLKTEEGIKTIFPEIGILEASLKK